MFHFLFDLCANSLHWMAKKMNPWFPGGMDYVKINVILFCIILPPVLIGSLGLNVLLLLGML
jgi:hypothetical protein